MQTLHKNTIKNKNNTKQNQKKQQTKKTTGGYKYGQGMKGFTVDVCNHKQRDASNFCRQINAENITRMVLYLKSHTSSYVRQQVLTPDEIHELMRFINTHPSVSKYIVKEFYNPVTKHTDFKNEIRGFENISTVLETKENAFGMPYQSEFIVGFSINDSTNAVSSVVTQGVQQIMLNDPLHLNLSTIQDAPNTRYFVINRKCDTPITYSYLHKMSTRTFHKFVVDILSILIKLQKENLVHEDIKPDNMMYCNGKFILIDWELSNKYRNLENKNIFPSWPVYYILNYGATWKTVYSGLYYFFMRTYNASDTHDSSKSKYMDSSLEYYTNMFARLGTKNAYKKVKWSFDLYCFGLVLYGTLQHNPTLQHSEKYKAYLDFVNEIYRFENPKKALEKFMSL